MIPDKGTELNAEKSGNQIRNLLFNYGPLIGTDRRMEGIKEEGAQVSETEKERERCNSMWKKQKYIKSEKKT